MVIIEVICYVNASQNCIEQSPFYNIHWSNKRNIFTIKCDQHNIFENSYYLYEAYSSLYSLEVLWFPLLLHLIVLHWAKNKK